MTRSHKGLAQQGPLLVHDLMERLPKDTGPGNEGGGGRVLRERNLALRWRMYVSSRDADADVDWVSPYVVESTRAVAGSGGGRAGRDSSNGRKKDQRSGEKLVQQGASAVRATPSTCPGRVTCVTMREAAVALADIRSASQLVAAFDHAGKSPKVQKKAAPARQPAAACKQAAGQHLDGMSRQSRLALSLHADSPDMIAAANSFMSHELKRLRQRATSTAPLSYQV